MEVSSKRLSRMQEKIVSVYEDQQICSGHGVLTSPDGFILTASHLFDSKNYAIGSEVSVKCNGRNGNMIAYIVGLDREIDLAMLKIEKTDCKFAKVAQEVRVGQGVHMITSSDGDIFSYTGGIVAFDSRPRSDILNAKGIKFIGENTNFVQVHGLHGLPGCSGSPIFDSRGHIVGIYSSGYARMDLLVHLAHITIFSQQFIQQSETSKAGEAREEEEAAKKKKKKNRKKDRKIENIQ